MPENKPALSPGFESRHAPNRYSNQHNTLHLGCGTHTPERYWNVDIHPLEGVDQTTDLEETPWPWRDNSWERIVAEHVVEHLEDTKSVLREAKRILKPDGHLEVTVPIGVNAIADPDHAHQWTYRTPEMYCGARHWDIDVGLTVVQQTVTLHSHLPGLPGGCYQRVLDWMIARYGAGEWCFSSPWTSGDYQVVFEA